MGSGGLIAALVVGAGGAAALVAYQRRREAQQQAQQQAASGDKCAPLANINAEAYAACKAASGLFGVVGGLYDLISGPNQVDEMNRVNLELNGPTKIPMPKVPHTVSGFNVGGYVSVASKTLEHANGCRPFWSWVKCDGSEPKGDGLNGTCNAATNRKQVGAPGSEKCKPGSKNGLFPAERKHPLLGGNINYFWEADDAGIANAPTSAAAMFKGTIDDPFTGLDWASVGSSDTPIPLDKPTVWYVKGEKVTCPAGKVLSPWSAIRDKSGRPVCTLPDGSDRFTANPKAGTGGGTTMSSGAQGTRGPTGQACVGGGLFGSICVDPDPDDPRTAGGGTIVKP